MFCGADSTSDSAAELKWSDGQQRVEWSRSASVFRWQLLTSRCTGRIQLVKTFMLSWGDGVLYLLSYFGHLVQNVLAECRFHISYLGFNWSDCILYPKISSGFGCSQWNNKDQILAPKRCQCLVTVAHQLAQETNYNVIYSIHRNKTQAAKSPTKCRSKITKVFFLCMISQVLISSPLTIPSDDKKNNRRRPPWSKLLRHHKQLGIFLGREWNISN